MSSSRSSSNYDNNCGYGYDDNDCEKCNDGSKASWGVVSPSKCYNLWAHTDDNVAGKVCIDRMDNNHGKITYSTNDGWYLNNVHSWLGCNKDFYPKNSDNYPKLEHFPMKQEYLADSSTSYSFTTSLHECNGCDNLSFCNYCDSSSNDKKLLTYLIAHAQVKHYSNSRWNVRNALIDAW